VAVRAQIPQVLNSIIRTVTVNMVNLKSQWLPIMLACICALLALIRYNPKLANIFTHSSDLTVECEYLVWTKNPYIIPHPKSCGTSKMANIQA
jgi:hypothetical protein